VASDDASRLQGLDAGISFVGRVIRLSTVAAAHDRVAMEGSFGDVPQREV